MDEKKKEDVKVVNEEKNTPDAKKKKIIMFSIIGGVSLLIVIVVALLLIFNAGKIGKDDAEKLVKSYLSAANNKDSDKYVGLVDDKGYIIFREEGEKKFKDKYKQKDKYIKKYMNNKDYDDMDDVQKEISKDFNSKYKYSSYEYSFRDIKEIKKSDKSSNIVIVKAKINVKSKYSSTADSNTLVLYLVKVNGKFKIIGDEIR